MKYRLALSNRIKSITIIPLNWDNKKWKTILCVFKFKDWKLEVLRKQNEINNVKK